MAFRGAATSWEAAIRFESCAFRAVLLLGADKTGRKRFYEEMIARAEALWEEYLQEKA